MKKIPVFIIQLPSYYWYPRWMNAHNYQHMDQIQEQREAEFNGWA